MSKKKTRTPGEVTWIKYHARHLEFTRKTAPPFDEFKLLIFGMDQEIESGPFWRGDLYNQGLKWYSEDQVMQLFGPSPTWKTWGNNGSVCGRVDTSRRREGLTYSHHAEVAYLDSEEFQQAKDVALRKLDAAELQDHYLALAVENELTVSQLRAKIKYDRGEGEDPLGDQVQFQKGTVKDRMVRTRDRIQRIIEDCPDDWDIEAMHMENAYRQIQLAIESAENRKIGDPAQEPTPVQEGMEVMA